MKLLHLRAGKTRFFEKVHATTTTFGKFALHLVLLLLLHILIFWHLNSYLGHLCGKQPSPFIEALTLILAGFTRERVLWWSKSSLEKFTDIMNPVTADGSGKNRIFQAETWRFDSFSAISHKLQDWNTTHLDPCFEFTHWNGAHHVVWKGVCSH